MRRKKIIGIIIGIVVILSLLSLCTNNTSTDDSNTSDENTVEEEVIEEQTVYFEDDEVVNEFFVNYQNVSNTEFKDFSSIRKYECSAENSNYYFEVRHLHNINTDENTLEVRIDESNETADAGVSAMREVYYYTVKTLDNTISDEDIYKIFDGKMNEEEGYLGEQTISTLKILITPDLELSGGHSRGHIDIVKILDE